VHTLSEARRRHPKAPFEQGAEAPQAGKTHRQADLGDRFVAEQQHLSREFQPVALPELVRCLTEYGGEAANELVPREARLGGDLREWPPGTAGFPEPVARAAQALVLRKRNHIETRGVRLRG
jgi:hypothetical protein